MNHLSNPQIIVLALWSFGIILARACGQSRVAAHLASYLGEKESNLRQRLREWLWDKDDKQGRKRTDWPVQESFVPLMKWVLALWPETEKRIALAIDASSLKQLFTVLSISVVYRGCAIPVAWVILPEGKPGAWAVHWKKLFKIMQTAIPSDWLVIVMADRGLYARWLYTAIQDCDWHPFLRINTRCLYRPIGETGFLPLSGLLSKTGECWAGEVTCFAHNSLDCTLLACWGAQYADPWFILTDLPPNVASATWYGMRTWIEAGFKDLKRGGWQWQYTRMTDPDRAARLWLALALATLWAVSIGGEVDENLPVSGLEELPPSHIARRNKKHPRRPRLLSCLVRGIIQISAMIMGACPIRIGSFFPLPWPQDTYP